MVSGAVDLQAFSKPTEHSEIDPGLFRIDEEKYLGVRFGNALTLLDETGDVLPFADLPNRPMILVPAYYTCDGSCFTVGGALRGMLPEVKALKLGEDYHVLFVSFDKNDTLETLRGFVRYLGLPGERPPGWHVTLFQDPEAIQQEMGRLGYKFFWSPRDKTFFHPTIIMVLTAEGRVARYLNITKASAKDIELALLEAKSNQFRPSETVDYLVSLCYSYNFKEGRYTVNIPVFVGLGSLLLGIGLLLGSLGIYRLFYRRKDTGQ
ncbi:MAG: SCO family protein [Magnetococcales bacterium]|nr:SCO family protein [Magnetococcales bacterium]